MREMVMSRIQDRVREKKESYHRYNFERLQEEAFAVFFDLAQEYTTLEYLYQISVAVPREFFGLESELHVIDQKTSRLEKVCCSRTGLVPVEERLPSPLRLSDRPYETGELWVFPIPGNKVLTERIPFLDQNQVLGLFGIYPKEAVNDRGQFFLEKFTNRIGYNLHQKLLIQQNINHIKFINQLVSDIEHNVISPNLYYKLFLIRLKKLIAEYDRIEVAMRDAIHSIQDGNSALSNKLNEIYLAAIRNSDTMEEEVGAFAKHYEHTSLFLETLFRRDHFLKGTYVLRKQPCNFRTEVIAPLVERYLSSFKKKGIAFNNSLDDVPDDEITLYVDKGLISQVFDNLFSNALKYTTAVEDQPGNQIKLVSCSRQILKDAFAAGVDGVRFNFFTTGRPLPESEARRLFDEGYRAASAELERGTGHGLHFVRNVVEIHGGLVGCEPQQYGNLIYFILPMKHHMPVAS